jgi:phosphoribosylformylglycinamidine synthase
VTEAQDYVLRHAGREVMRVPIDFLTGGIRYDRECVMPHVVKRAGAGLGPALARSFAGRSLDDVFKAVLAHRDVCSRRPIFERFDSVVRGTTSIPCGYADAGAIVPIPGAPLGLALSVDGNPRYAGLDAERAAELAVCEAVRNVVAVGAKPAGLTDCLNFGNPEIPEQMGEFVAAIDGIARAARELAVPFVSGNVSLYNTSAAGGSVPPSPIIACVGSFADISKSATMKFKGPGHALFHIGAFGNALGGSVVSEVLGRIDLELPGPRYAFLKAELEFILAAHDAGLIEAAHDISDGGLLVALVEMAFPTLEHTPIGVRLDSPAAFAGIVGAEEAYFGEHGGFVLEVSRVDEFLALAASSGGIEFQRIGDTTDLPSIVTVEIHGHHDLVELHEAWSAPLRDFYADALAETAG